MARQQCGPKEAGGFQNVIWSMQLTGSKEHAQWFMTDPEALEGQGKERDDRLISLSESLGERMGA